MWGVGIASEKKMRVEASTLVGEKFSAELTPFSFPHKDGGEVIENAPSAYVVDLWEKISGLLDQNDDNQRGYALSICKMYTSMITPSLTQCSQGYLAQGCNPR